jgi:hypothetical protein
MYTHQCPYLRRERERERERERASVCAREVLERQTLCFLGTKSLVKG